MIGLPAPSQTAWSLESNPPFVRPIRRGTSLFEQSGRGAMHLQVHGIDHNALWLWTFTRQRGEDVVEHAQSAPAHEPVVECLVGPVLLGSVLPLQAVSDHVHDPADHVPVIYSWHGERQLALAR
jgi:hypothetical protein